MSACLGQVTGDYPTFNLGDKVSFKEGDDVIDGVIVGPNPAHWYSSEEPVDPRRVQDCYNIKRSDKFGQHRIHSDYITLLTQKKSSQVPVLMYESGDAILIGDVVTWTKRPGSDAEYMGRGNRLNSASGVHQNQELWGGGSEAPEYTVHKILKNGSIRINAGSDPCIADAWTRYVNVPPSELMQTGRAEC